MTLTSLENGELAKISELLAKRIADGILGECILHARVEGLEVALDKALMSEQKCYAEAYGEVNTLKAQVCDLESKLFHLEGENKALVAEVNKARQETLISVEKMSDARVKAERKACYQIAVDIDTTAMVAETAAAAVAKRIRQRGEW